MGRLKYLVIHCTATQEGVDVSKHDIESWHLTPRPHGRGWSRVGYSDLISLDGSLISLRSFNTDDTVNGWELTNGVRGINSISRHVVYAGGLDHKLKPKDTRTEAQKKTLTNYVKYMLDRHPNIKVIGHNEKSNKACPSFDVQEWLKSII